MSRETCSADVVRSAVVGRVENLRIACTPGQPNIALVHFGADRPLAFSSTRRPNFARPDLVAVTATAEPIDEPESWHADANGGHWMLCFAHQFAMSTAHTNDVLILPHELEVGSRITRDDLRDDNDNSRCRHTSSMLVVPDWLS